MPVPWFRIGVALVVAGATIVGLQAVLHERPEATPIVPERPAYVALPSGMPRGRTFAFYLSDGRETLPDRVAPVARIDAEGTVTLLRPAPSPDGPIASGWLAAGVVLPTSRLADLSPVARAAFLELWRLWSGEGAARLQDVAVPFGVAIEPGELDRLARWIR